MKNLLEKTFSLVFMAMSSVTSLASDGVVVSHLGTNNTLVRVTGGERYFLMPVQESNDDATVNIVVDGCLDRTIYVRLAKTKVDYEVPFDLSRYAGHDVVFNIVTSQSRSSVREAKEDVCWTGFRLSDSFDTANREKYRPAFHHTPLYGWMNDPNGMVYKDGVWHLYYQHNPYGSKWQNMTWGHSTSTDLVNWAHHPVAIEPNGLGAVFSGSSVLDPQNTAGFGNDAIVSLYTSAGVSQIQSLAASRDGGETFEIYPGNPVITLESEARDPNMFWNKEKGEWTLTLAHALEREMLIFASKNLKEWELRSAFGKGLGAQDGVWECPDLFPLKVGGSDEVKWMMICNLNPGGPFGGSATQYFIGDFDGTVFKPDTDAEGNVPTKWLDYGKDHYAAVSWSDVPEGRRTVIGWMSNWQYAAEVPTMQFRSANTLPREIGLFHSSDGQVYATVSPSPELESLRDKLAVKSRSFAVSKKGRSFSLPVANDGICEILAEIDGRNASSVDLKLSNALGEYSTITFDPVSKTVSFDRRKSGITDFSNDFPAVTVAPTMCDSNKISLRIFIDRSSIEVFDNAGGRFVMTNLVFPTEPYTTLAVSADGGKASVSSLKVYSLNESK